MNDIDEILKRIAEICAVRSDSAIAKELGVTPQAIGNARKRGTIPYEKLCLFAEQHDVSLDCLLLGKEKENMDGGKIDPLLLEGIGSLYFEASIEEKEKYPQPVDTYNLALIYNRVIGRIPQNGYWGDLAKDEVQYLFDIKRRAIEAESNGAPVPVHEEEQMHHKKLGASTEEIYKAPVANPIDKEKT